MPPRPERCAWLMQGATNWMGDAGFLRKIEAQYRKFNYMGDVTWTKGKVAAKSRENGRNMVTLEVWCENQRDEDKRVNALTNPHSPGIYRINGVVVNMPFITWKGGKR